MTKILRIIYRATLRIPQGYMAEILGHFWVTHPQMTQSDTQRKVA